MSLANAEALISKMENAMEWPEPADLKILENIFKWQWFREADGDRLKAAHPGSWDDNKVYLVDPLAARIAEAFADLQFGEEPDFIPAAEGDVDRLNDLVRENNFPSELQQAAEIQVSEGEVWWRGRIEKDASDWPIVEFHSRANVIPLFRGRHIIAAAFITVVEQGDDAWRYCEVHSDGVVLNRLYKVPDGAQVESSRYSTSYVPMHYQIGKPFGNQVPLTDLPEFADLPPVWEHGLPMLAGRVLNKRGRTVRVGVSQYQRVQDLLFSLNEATTIGQQNMRLTARKRAVIDEGALQPVIGEDGEQLMARPVFDSTEEIFVQQGLDEDLESKQGPFKVLEYSFDAQAMVIWDDHLTEKILTRTRTAPALVGRMTEGANTAPAVRARLLDSTLAANGKARFWDDQVPRILQSLQMLDRLSTRSGGFGRSWSSAEKKPSMTRKGIIPEDPKDHTDRHATAVGAKLESRYTAIADLHPEWDDDKITEEVERIDDDAEKLAPPGLENGTINRSNLTDPATGQEQRVPGAGERD